VFLVIALMLAPTASAQQFEAVGERALGMGGAFVAVADDSSATWWNPAALAAGPFVDASIALTRSEIRRRDVPDVRVPVAAFSLTTPPFGVSYYRLRITDIHRSDPTGSSSVGREVGRVGVVRSLRLHQLGVTVLATVFPGLHVGTTLKYLRGRVASADVPEAVDADALLDRGEALDGGTAQGRFDADVGALFVTGPFRLGGVVKNVREPGFGGGTPPGDTGVEVPRQARIGVAYDGTLRRSAAPWVLSVDVDLTTYASGDDERRVIAAGAERWLFGERIGIRGGGRFNQTGSKERSATAGVSAAVRSGMFVEAHVVHGGADSERGWGLAARVSF